MGPKGPKEWDRVTIKIDGKSVDLEDAFEVFENVFEDVDEAFDHMENAFKTIDTSIHDKLNKLKIKLATKKPDKYEYIPDEDEDIYYRKTTAKENIDKQWEDHMEYRKTAVIRSKRNLHTFMVGAGIGVLLVIAITFFLAIDSKDKKVFGAPSKAKPTITEKLEPL